MTGSPSPLADPRSPQSSTGETHRLLAVGSGLALAFQFEQRRGVAGFQTAVFGLGSGSESPIGSLPVVISATDIGFGQGWELRTSGLWAEQVREQPFVHWSYGLEAFALAIEDPDELTRRGHGYRVPLGWELDFVATGDARPFVGLDDEPDDEPADGSFAQTGTIDGLVLTGDGEQPVTAPAERFYWVDDRPPHSDLDGRANGLANEDRSRPGSVILPTLFGPWTVARG